MNDIVDIFLKVCDYKSISKTSEQIYITQSALSQQIKNLETKLNSVLFTRNNKGVELTPEGLIVYKYFKKIKELYNDLESDLENYKSDVKTIKIEGISSICNYKLPCSIYDLRRNFPNLNIELNTTNYDDKVITDLLYDRIDIGFISEKIESNNFDILNIYTDDILLVGTNVINKYKDEITVDELFKMELLRHKEESIINTLSKIIPHFDRVKFQYKLESIEAVKMNVINGFGIAFLPYNTIKKEIYRKELKIIKIKDIDMIKQRVYMIVKPQNRNKEIFKYFEKYLLETMC